METTSAKNTVSNAIPNTPALVVAGVILLTAAGFVIVPPLLKKYSNKVYKSSIMKDEIDIDSLEPEIVRKEDKKTEE